VKPGADGAGYIQTSKGNGIITTGTGSVDGITTYYGNDRVTAGAPTAWPISRWARTGWNCATPMRWPI